MQVETADKRPQQQQQINDTHSIIIDLINVLNKTEESKNAKTNDLDDDIQLKEILTKLILNLNLNELKVTQNTNNDSSEELKTEISLFDETWESFAKLRSVYYLEVVYLSF
jgi:hypothetical protein